MKKDFIDARMLSAGNSKHSQDNMNDYDVAEYNLDCDVGELCINTSGAAYILPSGVKIVIPNEINCDVDKIYCSVIKESNKFQLNPTDQLLSPIVELTANGSKLAKSLRISIPYHYTACDNQTREIVVRVTNAFSNGLLQYEDLNSKLINTVKENADSFSGEVVSFVAPFGQFAVISRLKKDHVVVESEQPTGINSSVDSFTKLHFPQNSVVNPTDVSITVLKIDDAVVKNIVKRDHCPVSNVLQVYVSPKNIVFQKPVTVFLELPNSLFDKPCDKKMLRLLKSSHESEGWQDITTEVEIKYTAKNVFFQVVSFSKFWLVWKDFKIKDLQEIIRRTIKHQVQFLAMQQKPFPFLVLAQCVRHDLVEKRIKKLRKKEYYGNDPCTEEHEFVEGQRFKVKVTGDIKVKSNDKNDKKHTEEKILVKRFYSQRDPNKSGFCKFHIEPSKAASKTNAGYISFHTVPKTVCHAHESNEIDDNGNICVEKHLSEKWEYIDRVPIILESAEELSKVAKRVSRTDIFEKLRREISSNIGKEWQEFARCLGTKEPDLYRFKYNNPHNFTDLISEILCEWFQKKTEDSNLVTELVEALEGVHRKDLAEKVKDMYKEEKKRLETQ